MFTRIKFIIFFFILLVGVIAGCEVKDAPASKNENSHQGIRNDEIEYNEKLNGFKQVKGKFIQEFDGDTILVSTKQNGEAIKKKVRALLIDTPEVQKVKNGKVISPSMPLADEAREFLKNKLKGKEVTLIYDKGDSKDKFNRELAYIFVDGKCIQSELLREGLAIVRYVKESNTALYEEFEQAESEARSQRKGVWAIDDYVEQRERESFYKIDKAKKSL
ncbi:thermonuclease family protein [Bacillus thuringiensis]|uniref:Thermonuclease family protein n=1 Tax=Bacillus thuringiensis TaxID=1428 RepID=A0AAW9GJX9_BACTU|nr:thermonuclease family protein [Bacillus thuringiensis]MDY0854762.1 thermonuclease family protein [Bacillus thuringiensis]MDY4393598.1 thermonuclease family protein [Bacillus thuringiensis]